MQCCVYAVRDKRMHFENRKTMSDLKVECNERLLCLTNLMKSVRGAFNHIVLDLNECVFYMLFCKIILSLIKHYKEIYYTKVAPNN